MTNYAMTRAKSSLSSPVVRLLRSLTLGSVLLGSTAERVIRSAGRSVLAVRPV